MLNDLESAIKMQNFWHARSEWATETFGDVSVRGPLGALLHLAKEVQEAIADFEKLQLCSEEEKEAVQKAYLEELIDIKFLAEEAMWRSGMTYAQVADLAFDKLEKNKKRKWPKPNGDNPVEHVRD